MSESDRSYSPPRQKFNVEESSGDETFVPRPKRQKVYKPVEIASRGLRLNKTKALSLVSDEQKGRGVAAQENIAAGEYVCEYKYSTSYPQNRRVEVDNEYSTNEEGCYILEVIAAGQKICLDATVNLNCWGRYINHAPARNANVKPFRPLRVHGKWRVAFLATRDISLGEEILFDYGQERNIPEWMSRKKGHSALPPSSSSSTSSSPSSSICERQGTILDVTASKQPCVWDIGVQKKVVVEVHEYSSSTSIGHSVLPPSSSSSSSSSSIAEQGGTMSDVAAGMLPAGIQRKEFVEIPASSSSSSTSTSSTAIGISEAMGIQTHPTLWELAAAENLDVKDYQVPALGFQKAVPTRSEEKVEPPPSQGHSALPPSPSSSSSIAEQGGTMSDVAAGVLPAVCDTGIQSNELVEIPASSSSSSTSTSSTAILDAAASTSPAVCCTQDAIQMHTSSSSTFSSAAVIKAIPTKTEEKVEPPPSQLLKRARRECSLCGKWYTKLTDHLTKAHHLRTRDDRDPIMREAFKKTPDLRVLKRIEAGLGGSSTPARRKYACPFPICKGRQYGKLADHLAGKHGLKGSTNAESRHTLLSLAHKVSHLTETEKLLLQTMIK